MEGFIIAMRKSIREDMIVNVLTHRHYQSLYRFYGVRHSILHVGRKIDFEIEYHGLYMPKLRNISHLYRNYELQVDKVFIWQQFCHHLHKHLHDTKELEPFYFLLLDSHSMLLCKQDARRLICSMYAKLLDFEGRLYNSESCFICGDKLQDIVALNRGYLLSCPNCVYEPKLIKKRDILDFFNTKSLINLEDSECSILYETLLEGL